MLEKTEGTIKNGHPREISNTGHKTQSEDKQNNQSQDRELDQKDDHDRRHKNLKWNQMPSNVICSCFFKDTRNATHN